MREIWKDIPGYEGLYQVSNHGRVRSLDRVVVQTSRWGASFARSLTGKLLRPGRMAGGHLSVVLTRAHGSATVHSLVMLAFVGPRPPGLEIRHLDGDPGNNALNNLRYGTRSENLVDKSYHGQRKLTIAGVKEIRESRLPVRVLAKVFGVCENSIRNVKNRKKGAYDHVA